MFALIFDVICYEVCIPEKSVRATVRSDNLQLSSIGLICTRPTSLLPLSSQNVSSRIKASHFMKFIVNQISEEIKVTNGELPCSNSEEFFLILIILICYMLGLALKSLSKYFYCQRVI